MKITLTKSLLIGIIISLILQRCSGKKAEKNDASESTVSSVHAVTANSDISQHISSVMIPPVVTFAGETVPIEQTDVKEALEAELMINTFRHSRTLAIIKNFRRWKEFVTGILKEQRIPEDFLYVAVVESEFDNNALSPSGAVGMWQLLEDTAKEYGLLINDDADMRRDPKLSTEAAARFFRKAQGQLNNWTLVAASYNVGIQGMKNRLKDQKVNSFYDLHLNPETARYVYRILAFKLILENPEIYGYFVEENEKYAPYQFTTVKINNDIDNLVDFAKKNKTTYKQLRLLNPWFNNTEQFRLKVRKKQEFEVRIPVLKSAD